jgi:tripartite-type tricarboxylate transporter receptor subunit TctC
MKIRRHVSALLSLAAVAFGAARAATPFEEDTSPITIVAPFAAGTGVDVIARALAQELGPALKRTVIIDNKPGAGGNIGTGAVAKASPDGRTLLLTVNSTIVINPLAYRKLTFDPLKDLQPLTLISTGGYVVVVPPSLGVRSLADLVRKGKVGDLRYGSYGNGSMSHICTEMFKAGMGTRMIHVPYKSTPITDLIAGQIEVSFEPLGGVMGHIQSGRLSALAVTTPYRLPNLPNVPTMSDTMPGYDCRSWVGILLPAGTPAPIQQVLQQKISAIISAPDFVKVIDPLGHKVDVRGPAEFGKLIQADYAKWQAVVKPLDIQLD